MTNLNDILKDHVTLECACIDRMYLNGYVPILQVPGQLVTYMTEQLHKPIPSPVVLGEQTKKYVKVLKQYAADNDIPVIRFKSGQRKDDIANEIRKKHPVRDAVVFIGVAQEKAYAYHSRKVPGRHGSAMFTFTRGEAYVNHYYFYIDDADFGPCFIKVCTYAPYPVKVCLNGHEWAKRQLDKHGIGYKNLDNGFASCDDPKVLQEICDHLGPQHIEAFFAKWLDRLPWPISMESRRAGYQHQLSIWQLETSLTQVFDHPKQGRQFFEEVIRDNLDQGYPNRMQLVVNRRINKRTPGTFRTRVVNYGIQPSLHMEYKKTHVKQYFKENRALRTETTINDPNDFKVKKGLRHLPYLQTLGRKINRRLLDVQCVSQNCGLSAESINRVVTTVPSSENGDRSVSGLKLGDDRVEALYRSITLIGHLVDGFSNKELRKHMADQLDRQYTTNQMTYDLRRLRLRGIISRVPGRNRYTITSYGSKVAFFFLHLNSRVFRPLSEALMPDNTATYPKPLVKAVQKVQKEIDSLLVSAKISKSAA